MPSDDLYGVEALQYMSFEDNDNRNPDGTFASKGTGDQTGQSGTADVRQRQQEKVTYKRKAVIRRQKERQKELQKKLDHFKNEIEALDNPEDNMTFDLLEPLLEEGTTVNKDSRIREDPKAGYTFAKDLNYRFEKQLERSKQRMEKEQWALANIPARVKEMENLGVFDTPPSPNTHEIGKQGFRNGISKDDFKKLGKEFGITLDYTYGASKGKNKLEPILAEPIKNQEQELRPQEKKFDEMMQGKTIILDSVMKDAPDKIKAAHGQLMELWNSLSDFEREGIDVLRIGYVGKGRSYQQNPSYLLGTHSGRMTIPGRIQDEDGKWNDDKTDYIASLSEVTMHLNPDDSVESNAMTLMHELAHAKYRKLSDERKEEKAEFEKAVIEMGQKASLTGYVRTKWHEMDLEIANEIKHPYKKSVQDPKTLKMKQVTDKKLSETRIENIKKRHYDIIANETHSEYMGMINAPFNTTYHQADFVNEFGSTFAKLKPLMEKLWHGGKDNV